MVYLQGGTGPARSQVSGRGDASSRTIKVDEKKLRELREAIVQVEESSHATGYNRGIMEACRILGIQLFK